MVHNFVPEPSGADAVATKLADAPSFTVPVDKFVKHDVKKNSLDEAKMEKRFVKLADAAEEKKIKVEGVILTREIDLP